MTTRLIILIGVCCLLASCKSERETTPTKRIVVTDTVSREFGEGILLYPGKVVATKEMNLSFKVGGRIAKLMVKDGDKVKKGQLIATLDDTDYKIQLRATEAEYSAIKGEADRIMAMYKENTVSANDYDKAVYGLQQIEAKLQHHKDELSYTRLYAPISGQIDKCLFETNEVVGAGMPIVSMIDAGIPEVEISIPAADYVKRQDFEHYTCTFDVYPGEVYDLHLINTSAVANANQLYTFRFAIDIDGKNVPSPGMNTMVTIDEANKDSATLCVATGAVFEKSGDTMVYRLEGKEHKLKCVRVNVVRLLNDGHCVITSDYLRPGDIVVGAGCSSLSEGESVTPLSSESKSNKGGLL